MSGRRDATPVDRRRGACDSRLVAGSLVISAGRVWVLLGRSPTGGWAMMPPEAFGTSEARRSIRWTDFPPAPLPRNVAGSARAGRDRRGAWARR